MKWILKDTSRLKRCTQECANAITTAYSIHIQFKNIISWRVSVYWRHSIQMYNPEQVVSTNDEAAISSRLNVL